MVAKKLKRILFTVPFNFLSYHAGLAFISTENDKGTKLVTFREREPQEHSTYFWISPPKFSQEISPLIIFSLMGTSNLLLSLGFFLSAFMLNQVLLKKETNKQKNSCKPAPSSSTTAFSFTNFSKKLNTLSLHFIWKYFSITLQETPLWLPPPFLHHNCSH